MVGCTTIQYLAGAESTLAVCTWARETKIKVRTKDFVLVKSKNKHVKWWTYIYPFMMPASARRHQRERRERHTCDSAEVVRKEFSLTPHTGISSSTYQSFWFLNRFWEISGYPGGIYPWNKLNASLVGSQAEHRKARKFKVHVQGSI
jgi:hypothetical protein